jgi:hypothetical protein
MDIKTEPWRSVGAITLFRGNVLVDRLKNADSCALRRHVPPRIEQIPSDEEQIRQRSCYLEAVHSSPVLGNTLSENQRSD